MAKVPASVAVIETAAWCGAGLVGLGAVVNTIGLFPARDVARHAVRVAGAATDMPPSGAAGSLRLVASQTASTLVITHPSLGQRILTGLPGLMLYLALLGAFVVLARLVRSVRHGDPFTPDTTRRLLLIGVLLFAVSAVPTVDNVVIRLLTSGTSLAGTTLSSASAATWMFGAAFGFVGVAEVFRYGLRLRDEAAQEAAHGQPSEPDPQG